MKSRARVRRMPVLTLVTALALAVTPAARAHVQLEATLTAAQETPTPALYTASLDAAQEVPAPTVGAPSPTGTAKFALNADNTLTYTVTAQNLSGAALAAHIHQGDPGVPGGILVSLDAATLTGTTTALTDDQVTTLKAGGLYVNIHTANNISGEIPGQITAIPTPSGTATFLFDQTAKTLEYTITPQNLSGAVVVVHLHQGAPGVAGSPLVTLDNSLAGTTAYPDSVINALFDGGMYVNIHTALNPGGEVRGQIALTVDESQLCDCTDQTRKAFLACVNGKIKALSKEDKKSAAVRALRRAAKASSCGKTKVPKKALACCLEQTPVENILTGRVCAALPAKACTKRGGTSLGVGSSCLPANPCTPPASPSGAFLDETGPDAL
jgi:hypothetical protein